jgi:hypothetical protein
MYTIYYRVNTMDVTLIFADISRWVLSGEHGSAGGWQFCSLSPQLLPATLRNYHPLLQFFNTSIAFGRLE